MQDALLAIFLAVGLALGAGFVGLARWSRFGARRVLVCGLIFAAAIYVGFATRAENVSAWLGVEMTGVAIFGSLALFALEGSLWWLAAGWALHPLWDIQFHYIGTGSAFTPQRYPLLCASFDVAVAAYVAYAALRKLDLAPAPAAPTARQPAQPSKGRPK
ncbi:MAG: hypothetical protein HYS06_08905 [Methylocystis sp.]|nr:hypothetical protein [Methylocystis sp.]MBI3274520.1 hypothetical protein [Methylocystis sp.]